MLEPIWSSPEASYAPEGLTTQGNSQLGKEEFLTLLVAQLKNQDPMNPTNPEQMAAQLAQFSSLEQLIEVNDRLDAQALSGSAMAAALDNSSAVAVLGKDVLALGNQVEVTGNGDEVVVAGVGGDGGDATLTLYDANGLEVGSHRVGPVGGGRQEIQIGEYVEGMEPGAYTFELTVRGADDALVEVQTFVRAHINGVRYGPSGALLVSGGLEIPLANVVEIIVE